MLIRPMKKSEAGIASKIIGNNYSKSWELTSLKELNAMFNNKVIPPKYLVSEDKGKIVGLGGYIQSWMDYHVYNIFWINVEKSNQHKGIGTKIVQEIINNIKNIKDKESKATLILLTCTQENYNFYHKKFKFRSLARFGKKKYYLMGLNV